MHHNRRRFLGATGALTSYVALGRPKLATAEPSSADELVGHFEALGYRPLAGHPLITADRFNGGLRYDEMPRHEGAPARHLYVQACSRIEDIAGRNQPVQLAYFHMLIMVNGAPATRDEMLVQFLGFLIGRAGLDPRRLALVSTARFESWLPALQPFGLAPEQIVLRPIEEAVSEGRGSGFYNPPDHPFRPEGWTVSFHYALGGDPAPSAPRYPLPGYVELGELVFATGRDAAAEIQEGGFGIERLQAARGDPVPTFAMSRQSLLAALKSESQSRGVPLPPGYEAFSAM